MEKSGLKNVKLADIVVKLTVIINREQDKIMWQRIERVST